MTSHCTHVGEEGDNSILGLVARHSSSLTQLEDKHMEWTLDLAMDDDDDENTQACRPAVLSPFLPSRTATIQALLCMFPDLNENDCMLDVGCGDGRVLVAAAQATGCRGVGVDISPDCIAAAETMVAAEDVTLSNASPGSETIPATDEAKLGASSLNTWSGHHRRRELASRLAWVCGDCVAKPDLLLQLAQDHRATVVYLYIYPTLLAVIKPQLEALARLTVASPSSFAEDDGPSDSPGDGAKGSEQPPPESHKGRRAQELQAQCTLVTVGYHVEDWPWGFEASFAPRDVDMGPGPPIEIRKLKGPAVVQSQ